MATRKLKPEDKHVTRKELLAELVLIARAADASISQLREEFEAKLAARDEPASRIILP